MSHFIVWFILVEKHIADVFVTAKDEVKVAGDSDPRVSFIGVAW
jgi:hypothetical protein